MNFQHRDNIVYTDTSLDQLKRFKDTLHQNLSAYNIVHFYPDQEKRFLTEVCGYWIPYISKTNDVDHW